METNPAYQISTSAQVNKGPDQGSPSHSGRAIVLVNKTQLEMLTIMKTLLMSIILL